MVLESPDRGLLPALVVIFTTVALHRGISYWGVRRAKAALSRDKVFSELRSQGILQLGQLRRVYLEAPGEFSLVHYVKERPGLPLVPEAPDAIANLVPSDSLRACSCCGKVEDGPDRDACDRCENPQWTPALVRRSG